MARVAKKSKTVASAPASESVSIVHLLELLESRQLMSAGGEGTIDVALVDNTLPDYQALSTAAQGKVITFDGSKDSAAKVLGKLATWAGATGNKIRSISILSHGAEGKFRLGNEWISTEGEHEKAWRRLRGVLDAKAQIYVFGCNVAGEGGSGQLLLDHLATLSGAKVFGSTGLTGQGGNWLFEASSGEDPAAPVSGPVDGARLSSWSHSLVAGITITPTSPATTTEAAGTATFNVVLDAAPAADVTIPIASSDTTEGTVSAGSLTFTPADWNTPQTVTVTGVNDAVDDGDIAYTINIGPASSADGAYDTMDPADVGLTNTDNDTAGITVTPPGVTTTTEAGGQRTFDVVLNSQPTADVTITITSLDTTEGTVSTGSLTFTAANWNTPQTVTVTGVNDAVDDGDIGFTIQTGAATSTDGNYNGLDPADVSLTNLDDDTAGITVSPPTPATTTEAGGQSTFTVVLNSQPTGNVTIVVSSGDATEGSVSTSLLTFTTGNWNVAQTVTVTGVNDAVDDDDIAYNIVLDPAASTDGNYNNLNPADVALTNTDDDTAGVTVTPTSGLTTTEAAGQASFTVVLDTQPTAPVTVSITSGDLTEGTVSTASVTFNPGNWNNPQTVTITGVNDAVDDGDIVYSITTGAASSADPKYSGMGVSDVSVTNTDNDTAGITVTPTSGLTTTEVGGQASFNVVLTSQPTADVTIAISSNNTGEGTVSTASLTFTAGNWNVAQTVTVTGVDELIDDGNTGYTIVTGAAVSGDASYSGMNASDVSVTNTDNDTAGITVTPTSGLTTTEASGQATFDVVLTSQPTANVTIALSSSNTGEGNPSTTLLTFTPGNWSVAQTVTVTGADDFVDDGNQPYSIVTAAASSSDGVYNGMNASDVSLSNTDNDTAGITVSPTSGLNTTEAGSTAAFTVVLNSQPISDVTISISSGDLTEGTVSTSSLTFTAANWNVPQTVTVSAVDDTIIDGSITYSVITGTAVSADPLYSGINPSNVSVVNDDNDPTGSPIGSEFRVNTTTGNEQQTFQPSPRAVASDSAGNFVVVWGSLNQDGSGWGVYSQRYNSSGVAQGVETRVNVTTASDQSYATVAMDSSGNYVVTWSSFNQDAAATWGIYARRYNAAGVALSSEFRVNTTTAGDQQYSSVAVNASGAFVIAWTGNDAFGKGVFFQRYDASGVAQGVETRANSTQFGDQTEPSVAIDSAGNFVVVWTSGDGDDNGVFAQRFNASGVAQGAQFRVNTETTKAQEKASVAMASTGEFVVTWSSLHQDGAGNFWGVFAQRYNAAGVAQGSEFKVNSSVSKDQFYSSIAVDSDGDFVIAFQGENRDGSGWGVFAQQYDPSGVKRGGEFRVNTTTANDQEFASVAMDANGDYVVVWTSTGQDGSGNGVYGQRFFGGNDAPVNNVPGAQSINEDATLTFSTANSNLISISDVDAAGGIFQVTLTGTNGLLTLSGTTGLTFSTGDGTADATMTFTGTIADINAALDGMSFTPTANFNGAASVQITTNDLGSTGWDSQQTDTDTVNVTVNAVNDAPANTVPGAQTINEDVVLAFSSGSGNQISISDVDAGSSSVRVQLLASNGTLTLSTISGLTFTVGDGTSDNSMTFTGTVAAINTALNGMTFTPTSNFNGAASVQIATNDLGNTGSGGSLSDTDAVAITVNAVNDAPVNNVPSAQTINEDTPLVFSTGNSNLISITDVDSASGAIQVVLTASNGLLSLNGTTGLTFTVGDGTSDSTMTFTGMRADVNAALDGMTFTPTSNFNGAASVQISTNDQGNTGSGGALSDTDTVAITVNAVNDAPVNTVPGAQSTNEDTTRVFSSGNGNAISVADVDVGGGNLRVTLMAANGLLTLSQITGLSFTVGDGTSDATMTFTGTPANINAALNGLAFVPTPNYNGAASVQITTNDLGNTGSGGSLGDTDAVAITVNSINDAPVNTVPGLQTINEDQSLVFALANGNAISVADLDVGGGNLRVTLTASNGLLTLSQITGLSFTVGDGTSDATMTFTGTVTDINAALEDMVFAPTANFNGAASVQISTNDLGNSGAPGALSDTDTVAITVNAVNDAPVSTVPAAQVTNEDTALVFSSGNGNLISIADLDAAAGSVRLTLSVTNGALTLASLTGLSFITGDGTADATMTFTGTVANINTALNGLTFLPSANYNGGSTLSISVDDQGNTGSGGAHSDSDNVNITVNAVNDSPVLSGTNDLPAIDEDDFSNTGMLVSDLIAGFVSDNDAGALAGIAVTGVNNANGAWQYTLDGSTWVSFGSPSGAAARLLPADTTARVRFVPNANFNGVVGGFIYRAWDQTSGVAGGTADTSSNGGSTAFSAASATATITVNAINDAPVNTVPGPQTINEDTPLTFDSGNGNLISIADLDANPGSLQVTLTAANGLMTLSQVTGLTFSVGDGLGDGTMTFTGTVAAINAALDGLIFSPNLNYNGPASIQIQTDDQGNTGAGGALTDTSTIAITINAVNDVPTISGTGGVLVYTENDGQVIVDGAITLGDVDDVMLEGAVVWITGYVSGQDVLDFVDQNGITGVWDSMTGTLTLIGSATVVDYQTALRSITYQNTSDDPSNGGRTVRFTVNDGSANSATYSRGINVNPVNDAPFIGVPVNQVTDEDTVLTFSAGNGNSIIVTDPDDNNGQFQVILTATNGVLTLGTTSGLNFTAGDGVADATMTFKGTLPEINAALEGMTFSPNTNYNGPATIQIDIDDQGHSGSGGPLLDTKSFGITVNAVNDAPVNTVPGPQAVNEDNPLVFSSGNGNLIAISDLDAASGLVKVTLSVSNGVLTLATNTGLTFITGDGLNDATMTFTGTVADINAALSGLAYEPSAHYNGPDTLTITTEDQGNTGSGGSLIDSDNVAITVNAVNDAPVVSVPGNQNVDEDTDLVFSGGNGNAITIDDLDLLAGTVQVTLTATNGLLTLSGITGLSFTVGDGTADATMTFTGTLADINAALDGLIYRANLNYNGPALITVSADDQGNTGIGGALSDSQVINVDVQDVNDAPINTVPPAQVIDEDNPLVFSSGNGKLISISDVDAASGLVRVTLTVAHGTLTLASLTGLSFIIGDGAGDATMTFTGTVANINAALDGLLFQPALNYNGADTLTITTNDQGNTGSPGALADTDTVGITINAVNDVPVVAVPGPQTVAEDGALTFSSGGGNGISVSDVDVAGDLLEVTIAASNGRLTLTTIAGLTFIVGDGANDASMVFTGTLAAVNAALEGLTFRPTHDYFGAASVTVTVDDQGNNGSGGPLVASQTVNINVTPVNDAPVITRGGTGIAYTENDPATAIDPLVTLVDVDSLALSGAIVRILNVVSSEDVLVFVDQNGISGTWDASTGTLTLSGVASVADYQAALRSIAYRNTSENPVTAPRAVRFTVSDGALTSLPVDYTVTVTRVNDAPTGKTVPGVTVLEDSEPIAIALWKFLADAENADSELVLDITSHTNHKLFSQIMIDPDTGKLIMGYAPDENGSSTITISATDQDGASVTIHVHVTVQPVNDAPTLATSGFVVPFEAGQAATAVDSEVTIGDIDSDIAGATVRILNFAATDDVLAAATLPEGITASWDDVHGVLTLSGNASVAAYQEALRSVTYVNVGGNGNPSVRSVEFVVSDGELESNVALAAVNVMPAGEVMPPPPVEPPPAPEVQEPDESSTGTPKPPEPEAPIAVSIVPLPIAFPVQPDPVVPPPPAPVVVVEPAPPVIQPEPQPQPAPAVAIAQPAPPPPVPVPIPVPPPPILTPKPQHYQTAQLFKQLDELTRDLDAEAPKNKLSIGAVGGLTTTLLSVGYVIWCLRGGTMLAALLTTLPMWRWLDPLPVLDLHEEKQRRKRKKRNKDGKEEPCDEDEQRIESMMD